MYRSFYNCYSYFFVLYFAKQLFYNVPLMCSFWYYDTTTNKISNNNFCLFHSHGYYKYCNWKAPARK